MTVLGARRFTAADQVAFAALTGDRNPLHLDEVAARRSLFGERVVHGLHVALWAVDRYLGSRPPLGITGIKVTFAKPVLLDEEVRVRVAKESEGLARLRVEVDETMLVDVRLALGPAPRPVADDGGACPVAEAYPGGPVERSFHDLAGLHGSVDAVATPPGAPAFPALVAAAGDGVVARLLPLTTIVGMECPGAHSLFAGFDVRLEPGSAPTPVRWRVQRVDDRFGAVSLSFDAGCVVGEVSTFVRPSPAPQPAMADLAGLELGLAGLADVRALVVGGSRGLGELTAKLLAIGGADVALTWHRGEADAQGVVADIVAGGGRARVAHLDVGQPGPGIEALAGDGFVPTHLYYFSSPRIFARRTRLFHHELLASFMDHYVTGFVNVVAAARQAGSARLVAYYPSSVAVEEPLRDLTEYIVAKVAGERTAALLAANEPWLEADVERLPRLPTDQTATIGSVPAADPVAVMADAVRRTTAG